MEKFSYLFFVLLFSLPSLMFLFIAFKKQIAKNKTLLITAIIFSIFYTLIADPVGINLGAWAYDRNKSIWILFTGGPIETVLLGIAMSAFFAILVVVLAEKEDRERKYRKRH